MKHSKKFIIWLDEVGRWPLAGPVAVGGVFCLPKFNPKKYSRYDDITDSKKLSSWQREYLAWYINACSELVVATSFVSAKYIDRHGIVAAIRKASLDVIHQIIEQVTPLLWIGWEQDLEIVLDGKTDYGLRKVLFTANGLLRASQWQLQTIIKGDSLIREIGAASIIAKVQRDEYMTTLSYKKKYRPYEFNRHKGYGTLIHRNAIAQYWLSDIHRATFCKNILL